MCWKELEGERRALAVVLPLAPLPQASVRAERDERPSAEKENKISLPQKYGFPLNSRFLFTDIIVLFFLSPLFLS